MTQPHKPQLTLPAAVTIVDDIPIPDRNAPQPSPLGDILKQLKVGASFNIGLLPNHANIKVHTYASKLGIKVRVGKGPNGERRCWRIE